VTQYKVTLSGDDLHGLFQNDEGLARLMEKILNQVLQAQATEAIGALPYERSESRRGLRNGLRDRGLETRVGSLRLSVPQFRKGTLSTSLWERYQRSEMALLVAMMEMVVNGVSTRKVTKITEELCGASFSKSTVSELCKSLDPLVDEWNERPLGQYPFILMDAIVIKVRTGGRVVSRSVMVATGISLEGYREILGLKIGDSESHQGWSEYLDWLKQRGLKGVDYLVSDHHQGLVKAIQERFQGATWQRCQAHFTKNILDATPKALKSEVKANLRSIFTAPDSKTARALLNVTLSAYEDRAPKAMETLENGFDDAIAVLALPDNYRRKLRTTNIQERLNQEIRRRERVIRIFPNERSAIRLIGAVLMEKDEEWITGRIYMNMTGYLESKKPRSSVASEAKEKIAAAD
jgi:putative transposase